MVIDPRLYENFGMRDWIAVDLDGTLAVYNNWVAWDIIGPPIPRMVERVKAWLQLGIRVKIFTARVAWDVDACHVTGKQFTRKMMEDVIGAYTAEHIGLALKATAIKDFYMRELWDDRAIGVVANTGITVAEEYEAQLEALKGKP